MQVKSQCGKQQLEGISSQLKCIWNAISKCLTDLAFFFYLNLLFEISQTNFLCQVAIRTLNNDWHMDEEVLARISVILISASYPGNPQR